jgi:hypothetical protein
MVKKEHAMKGIDRKTFLLFMLGPAIGGSLCLQVFLFAVARGGHVRFCLGIGYLPAVAVGFVGYLYSRYYQKIDQFKAERLLGFPFAGAFCEFLIYWCITPRPTPG